MIERADGRPLDHTDVVPGRLWLEPSPFHLTTAIKKSTELPAQPLVRAFHARGAHEAAAVAEALP